MRFTLVRSAMIAATVVVLVAACGGGDKSGAADLAGEDHQADLATGESEFVTDFVVPVDGYRYVDEYDAPYENLMAILGSLDRDSGINAFGAVSLHSIVADDPSQNTAQAGNGEWEVGYLHLIQVNQPIRVGEDEDWSDLAIKLSLGGGRPYEMIDQLDLSGTTVSVFENSELPDSRFTYAWLDQGVGGILDGADRAPLERWLAAYLRVPKFADGETAELAERLVSVPGFRYSNVDPGSFQESELSPLVDLPHSLHFVSDRSRNIGMLAIAPSPHGPVLEAWAEQFADASVTGSIDVHGKPVEVLDGTSGDRVVRAYRWDDGTYAAVLTTNPDLEEQALTFIDAFLGT